MAKKLLTDSVEKFSQLDPGTTEEGVSAFNSFRRGVTQASGGREAPPEELLGPLEPKEPVLRFLSELYEKKRMYRKQIEAVYAILMHVDSWLLVIGANEHLHTGLPDELRVLYQEGWTAFSSRPAKEVEVIEEPVAVVAAPVDPLAEVSTGLAEVGTALGSSAPAPTGEPARPLPSGTILIKHSVAQAKARAQATAAADAAAADLRNGRRAHGPSDPVQLLERSCEQMRVIEFSTEDMDSAIDVFGLFRTAVNKVCISRSKDDDVVLEKLEPKDLILAFLIDMHEKQRKYRSQVKSIFVRLWEFDTWQAAIKKDTSVHALVQDLTKGDGPSSLSAAMSAMEKESSPSESSGSDTFRSPRSTAAIPAAGPLGWAAWFSVDPREGKITPYTQEIATTLELHWSEGEESVDISSVIPGAAIVFRPYLLQKTKGGSRHVCRVEMREPGANISISVDRNEHGKWQQAKGASMPTAEERTIAFPPASAVACMKRGDYSAQSTADSRRWIPAGGYPDRIGLPTPGPAGGSGREPTSGSGGRPISGSGGGPTTLALSGMQATASGRPQAKKEGGQCRQS